MSEKIIRYFVTVVTNSLCFTDLVGAMLYLLVQVSASIRRHV